MKKARRQLHASEGKIMKNEFDRRAFMRISAMSIGAGALLQFAPLAGTARGSTMSRLFHKQNGEGTGPFSIVQLSDTHVGFQGPPDPLGTKAFERAVDVINALDPQPELILFTGDLTHDSDDPAEHAKRFAKFKSISDRLRVKKRMHVPGEHDAALDGGVLFRENFGETHYSFDHRGAHFVALDNVSKGKPVVGAEQIAWLKQDLARYPKTAPIVVFTHRPLFDLKPEWEWFTADGDAVMNVLAPYESVTVLYGHIHRPQHNVIANARHHAARSLIFAFPDPATTAEKKPLPFNSQQPFHNLGIRTVSGSNVTKALTAGLDDVELSLREVSGTEGIQQMLRSGESL
jgi:3',5'-cyclic AMP phosphodiesterase CpdA